VVSKFLSSALKNQDITIYGDGSQTRTFTYVDDTVETCYQIMKQGILKNDVINIGSDKLMTVLELAKMIIAVTGSQSKIIHLPPLKEGDMTRRQPDNSKMKEILNRELIPVEDGVRKMIVSDKYLKAIGLK
jgi:UDP-glucose 4-epimerase